MNYGVHIASIKKNKKNKKNKKIKKNIYIYTATSAMHIVLFTPWSQEQEFQFLGLLVGFLD